MNAPLAIYLLCEPSRNMSHKINLWSGKKSKLLNTPPCHAKKQRQQKAETKEQKEEVLDRKIIKTNEDFLFDFFVPFFAFFCTVKKQNLINHVMHWCQYYNKQNNIFCYLCLLPLSYHESLNVTFSQQNLVERHIAMA